MWWARVNLGTKLFLSYLIVVLVGVATVFVAVSAIAPDFFLASMRAMMAGPGAGGMGGMMGPGTSGDVLTASLDAAFRQALMQALAFSAVLAAACALALSYVVARQIAGPVRHMLWATRRIGAGHYAERVVVPAANAHDELGALAASFNDMASALEQTERRRLELIGDVAHELRTPIATLTGYLEGLLDGVVASTPETWAKLHTESLRLRRLVDDLQDLSRAEARRIPLHAVGVTPDSLVAAARERVAQPYAEKGLELRVELPPSLPAVTADPDRAVQVLTNLLTNALRYTPAPGTVHVRAARADGAVTFTVTDTGIGIASDHLPHIFERFYRVETSRSRLLGGSGIGLTIAKALVEAMGGAIRAESAGLDQGSSFIFTLPIAQ